MNYTFQSGIGIFIYKSCFNLIAAIYVSEQKQKHSDEIETKSDSDVCFVNNCLVKPECVHFT